MDYDQPKKVGCLGRLWRRIRRVFVRQQPRPYNHQQRGTSSTIEIANNDILSLPPQRPAWHRAPANAPTHRGYAINTNQASTSNAAPRPAAPTAEPNQRTFLPSINTTIPSQQHIRLIQPSSVIVSANRPSTSAINIRHQHNEQVQPKIKAINTNGALINGDLLARASTLDLSSRAQPGPKTTTVRVATNTVANHSGDVIQSSSTPILPKPARTARLTAKDIRERNAFRIEFMLNRDHEHLESIGIVKHSQDEVDNFLQVMLSIPTEELIPNKKSGWAYKLERNLLDPLLKRYYGYYRCPRAVPAQFRSFQDYRQIFTPLFIFNSWAAALSDFRDQTAEAVCFNFRTLSNLAENLGSVIRFEVRAMITKNVLLSKTLKDSFLLDKFLVTLTCDNKQHLAYIEEFYLNDNRWEDFGAHPVTSYPQLEGAWMCMPANTRPEQVYMVRCLLVMLPEHYHNIQLTMDTKICIQPVSNMNSCLRVIETLKRFDARPIFRNILHPSSKVCRINNTSKASETFTLLPSSPAHNQPQRDAILATLSAVFDSPPTSPRILLIQGPPGTGKSHTLVGIVEHLFANWTHDRRMKLMICAPSNAAIDQVGHRLCRRNDKLHEDGMRHPKRQHLELLRIGRLEKVSDEMLNYHILEKTKRLLSGRQKSIKDARRKAVLDADVILTTLNSSQKFYLDEIFVGNAEEDEPPCDQIDCLLVDEAAQCSEPELLMPLLYPVNKVILIGDPCQLPATVKSRVAEKNNYHVSLFERFVRTLGGTPNTLLTLTSQYRMHPTIVSFPSAHFYDSRLLTVDVGRRSTLHPYLVFNVTGTAEAQCSSSTSKYNEKEGRFILNLLKSCLAQLCHDLEAVASPSTYRLPLTIGVISFYKGQKQAIIRQLNEAGRGGGGGLARHVQCRSVDEYQGNELDVVILATCRANTAHDIGFLSDPKRMNVALTRAKLACYVCLDFETFDQNGDWRALIDNAQVRQLARTMSWEADANLLTQTIRC